MQSDLEIVSSVCFFFFFLNEKKNVIFGCAESSLLCAGFFELQLVGATLQLWHQGFSLQWLLLLQDQESNLGPLHWQADSEPLNHQGSPSQLLLCSGKQESQDFLFFESQLTVLLRTPYVPQRPTLVTDAQFLCSVLHHKIKLSTYSVKTIIRKVSISPISFKYLRKISRAFSISLWHLGVQMVSLCKVQKTLAFLLHQNTKEHTTQGSYCKITGVCWNG